VTAANKCPRNYKYRYNPDWADKFSWLRYSISSDTAWCAPCFAFPVCNKNLEFIETGFNDWKNAVGDKRGSVNSHNKSDIHVTAVIAAEHFLKVVNDKVQPITSYISKAYQNRVLNNRSIIKSLVEVVFICARRGFPLCGNWNSEQHTEDGNFVFLVNWAAQTNPVLRLHLQKSAKNATYLFPNIQNEFIACIESEMRNEIVVQCNKSPFISIMAEEKTDCSTIEQLSPCIIYVRLLSNGKHEVCEDFLGFAELKNRNAETICQTIISLLTLWGIDLTKI